MKTPDAMNAPSLPLCLWLGLAGGMLAGALVGLGEALWVLTGTGAGEYWALFVGVLVYGVAGGACGSAFGALLLLRRALGGMRDPARGLGIAAVVVGCAFSGALLWDGLLDGVYRGRGLPTGVLVGIGAGVLVVGVVAAWLLPIVLTRTPLKALARPKGAIAAWAGLLMLAALFAVAPAPGGGGTVAPDREADAVHGEALDVLLVVIDGLRVEDMERPGLATVRAGGVFFDRAFAQSGWSGGALASVLTGAPPPVHRVLGRTDVRDRALPTLLEVLQTEGYATAWVEGGTDGPRAAGLVSGTDWTARPGRGDALPESPRRLRLVQLLETRAAGAVDHGAVLGDAEGFISANRARGNRWAVLVRLDASDDERASAIDAALSESLERLAGRGDLERAVVAVVGGTSRSARSRDLTDARLHVPLVLMLPERALAGLHASWTVRTMDLASTLVVQARAVQPTGWHAQDLLEQDAVDLLTGRIAPPPDRDFEALPDASVISEQTLARPVVAAQDLDGTSRIALRDGPWKYVRRKGPDGNTVEELYDLANDPQELTNLAGPAARERVRLGRRLDRMLAEWSGGEGTCGGCLASVADPADCALACGSAP